MTCSTEHSKAIQAIQWLVDEDIVWEDSEPISESGQIISNMLYYPEVGHEQVKCRVIEEVEGEHKDIRSSYVLFSVLGQLKIVKLQRTSVSQAEKNPWVPFDVENWNKEKDLKESAEENAEAYSRNIYQFMYEKPHDSADHFHTRKDYHQHNRNDQEFVDELPPISLPLKSSTSKVSWSSVTSILLLLFLVLAK